jgi:sulfur transfer protein SufE
MAYEEIIQLEQALIELDEQNTVNAMEIRKREAKVFLMKKQIEDNEDDLQGAKENTSDTLLLKEEI